MLNIYRILLFVPPILLLVFPAFAQIQGKIEQISGSSTYRVSVVPSVNWMPPQSTTSSAQITLRAPSGKMALANFQSFTGNWSANAPVISPSEAPDYDYFSFSLNTPLSSIAYINGIAVPLFTFSNALGCSYIELVDNQADPFLPPNSLSVNIGNSFSILGAGIGQNAYQGNTNAGFVACPPLDVYVVAQNNPVRCFGETTDFVVQTFGGVEPYQVNWQNTTTGSQGSQQIQVYEGTGVFSAMQPGQYIFTIKDGLDSVKSDTFILQQPAPLVLKMGAYDASCNGSLDGVAFVDDVDGGTVAAGYTFSWENQPSSSSPTIGFLNPGNYTVTVSDDNGCTAIDSVTVGAFAVIYPNPYIRDATCHDSANGIIDLYPVGANPPFTYEWSSNASSSLNSSAWNLSPGYYGVTLTDATGVCFQTAEFIVKAPPAIEADYSLTEPVCFGDKGYLNIVGISNAFAPWKVSVIGGQDTGDGQRFELEAGMPARVIVEDAKGCKLSEDFLIPARQELFLELGESFIIKYGEEVKLDPDIFPLSNVNLEWTPAEGLSCDDCPFPIASPKATTTYRLRMVDDSGCTREDNLTIGVNVSRDIYIPNAFSPNYDGINDFFMPYAGFEVTSIQSMQVFDRWGGLIYASDKSMTPGDPHLGWDGTARGKPVKTGTYLYTMNVEFIDGEVVLFSGEVNLLR